MKRYLKTYFATLFIVNIIFTLLIMMIRARFDVAAPFVFFELGAMAMSVFLSLAIWIFKLEKGNSIVNVILAYLFVIPGIYVFRFLFRAHLFRLTWLIYIVFVVIGIIYGIVLFIVSKKYKDEVNELNRLLNEKESIKEE